MYPGKKADEALYHLYTNKQHINKIILWLFLAKLVMYIYFFRYVKEKMAVFDDVIAYETNYIYIY